MSKHILGDDDVTPAETKVAPLPQSIRGVIKSIDSLAMEMKFLCAVLAEIRAEIIAAPERATPYYQERLLDVKKAHRARINVQIADEERTVRAR